MAEPTTLLQFPVLVCFAVPQEAKFFSVPPELRSQIVVLITGMGPANAGKAFRVACDMLHPGLVLTCGFAGGLKPGLPVGTLLYTTDESGGLDKLLARSGAVSGTFHTAPRIAVTVREKEALYLKTGAHAVDMESAVIRDLCKARQVPSAILRVISDAAEEDLPLDFNALMTETLELDYRKLAKMLIRSPNRISALIGFQRRTRFAAQRLGKALTQLTHRQRV